MKKTYVVVRNGEVKYVTRLKKRDVWLRGDSWWGKRMSERPLR